VRTFLLACEHYLPTLSMTERESTFTTSVLVKSFCCCDKYMKEQLKRGNILFWLMVSYPLLWDWGKAEHHGSGSVWQNRLLTSWQPRSTKSNRKGSGPKYTLQKHTTRIPLFLSMPHLLKFLLPPKIMPSAGAKPWTYDEHVSGTFHIQTLIPHVNLIKFQRLYLLSPCKFGL
jgi:hypothetical protein